jgi:hypothetical protein
MPTPHAAIPPVSYVRSSEAQRQQRSNSPVAQLRRRAHNPLAPLRPAWRRHLGRKRTALAFLRRPPRIRPLSRVRAHRPRARAHHPQQRRPCLDNSSTPLCLSPGVWNVWLRLAASGRRLADVWQASGRLGLYHVRTTSGHVWARLGTSGHVWTSGTSGTSGTSVTSGTPCVGLRGSAWALRGSAWVCVSPAWVCVGLRGHFVS